MVSSQSKSFVLPTVLVHCDVRGSELYCGEDSHVVLHEQGGAAQLGGVTVCPLPNLPDGTFDLDRLASKLKSDRLHEPVSKLVVVENTLHGLVVPQAWVLKLSELARARGLRLHLDGARLWNAAAASGQPAAQLAAPFDSVTFCLSKGLGAPAGSLLCGSRGFVERARRVRKALGGGMRQVGVLAAAGLVALERVVPLLPRDHLRARALARAVAGAARTPAFQVDVPATNMVLVRLRGPDAADFVHRLQVVRDGAEDDRTLVRGLALNSRLARFVLYYNVDDEMLQAAVRKVQHVVREFEAAEESNGAKL